MTIKIDKYVRETIFGSFRLRMFKCMFAFRKQKFIKFDKYVSKLKILLFIASCILCQTVATKSVVSDSL